MLWTSLTRPCFPDIDRDADFTLQLDEDNHAISVTDSKVRANDLFLGRGQLPAAGGLNPLLELWNTTFGIEIFYFAASSLEITNVLR